MFLTALVASDFKKAFGQTTKSYQDKNTHDDLKGLLSLIPEGFDIGSIVETSPTNCQISVKLKKGTKSASVTAELIKEAWPYKKDVQGDWGIVPDSIRVTESKYKKDADLEKDNEAEIKRIELLNELRPEAEKYGIEFTEDADPNEVSNAIFNAIEGFKKNLLHQAELLEVEFTEDTTTEELETMVTEKGEEVKLLVAKAEDLGLVIAGGTPPSEIQKLIDEAKKEV